MNKTRVEALSDGIFAIVMTLLIIEVKVPELEHVSDAELWHAILGTWPLIVSYALSFLVLAVFWINHHFLFHTFARVVDRQINLMNMLYLMLIAFVPYSAHLLGVYTFSQPAVIVYGLNILAVGIVSLCMTLYIQAHPHIGHDVPARLRKQGRIRSMLTMAFYVLGILASFVYIPLSIGLFLFPMFFNIIPGTLDLAERLFGLEL